MYFNDSNTVISNEKKNTFNFKVLYYFLFGITLIFTIIVIILLFNKKEKKSTFYLELIGNNDIVLYQDAEFTDPGFKAYDSEGNDLSNLVTVNNSVNSSVVGEYYISYILDELYLERIVTVIPKKNQITYLILSGEPIIFQRVNTEYIEPGYVVFDSISTDLNDSVVIDGNVDTSKAGTYTLVYSVTNGSNVTISEKRTIIVTDSNLNLGLVSNKPTAESVSINVNVMDNYFDYVLLPDGNKSYDRDFIYKVKNNGNYKFILYSTDGSYVEKEIYVNNIDNTPPIISKCTGSINSGKTTFTVTSSDKDISKYLFDNQYTSKYNSYTFNKEIESIYVTVYDEAGNFSGINCKAKRTTASPLYPNGSEKIIYNVSTDTLNVWIERKTRSGRTGYYVTHIWAANPYNQLKAGVPNNFSKTLEKSNTILSSAISKYNLNNKLAVAINGSGFVKSGVWDTGLANSNKGWNLTSVSPIVIVDGVTLRDFAGAKIPSYKYTVYGFKKDGYFGYYKYSQGTNSQFNINVSNQIKSDGVKNTWAFSPLLVWDGKSVTNDTSKNIRNAICQIDKNNFLIFTDIYNNARNGFSFKELANTMISYGCKYGFNLDGGGSTSLVFKDKNSTSGKVITGNTRAIADILYFHE
ncbi:MAG: DUF5011 domain-containing protein [Bacilli bacterium]|nr:DUF5011 domain-containing protein [Bacilli bacterium]